MKLSNKIKTLKLVELSERVTEDIISHFFSSTTYSHRVSKTKLSEHTIDEIELIRTNNTSHLLRVTAHRVLRTSLIYNKASNQPKRTTTTLEININSIREYKLKRLLNE